MKEKNILTQLDRLFAEKRISEVEPFLQKCIQQAKEEEDKETLLMLYNEMTGYYRSLGRTDEAIAVGRKAEQLIEELDFSYTEFHATTLVNLATAYRAGGEYEEALNIYQKVDHIYDDVLIQPDIKRAGLDSNMSMA